jgi:hypothetical protein
MATLLLIVQPIATNMLISDRLLQRTMLIIYLIGVIGLAINRFPIRDINSTVSKQGHLKWNILLGYEKKIDLVLIALWLIFFLFPLFYEGQKFGLLFGVITLLIMIYNYYKDKTVGSMWCWVVNSIMIYYAIYLLFYLPFYK